MISEINITLQHYSIFVYILVDINWKAHLIMDNIVELFFFVFEKREEGRSKVMRLFYGLNRKIMSREETLKETGVGKRNYRFRLKIGKNKPYLWIWNFHLREYITNYGNCF